MPKEIGILTYKNFLSDNIKFKNALFRVINKWTHSCEQFLTNESMNRIAWLGQAAMCIETGIPNICRSGFKLLSDEQQKEANNIANNTLYDWVIQHEKYIRKN